ncbi:MAG: hydrogen gas-evolving membrane-bound hydrogenase subunit E [Myxococcota bacterium]|nr:hydrogen gas-evolving membrane-bound hydrogenase subunit E [Myxococcota bacterium]
MTEAVQMGMATGVVALPALAGLLLLVWTSGDRAARLVGILGSGAACGLVAILIGTGASQVFALWEMAPDFFMRIAWRVDFATLCLSALVSGIGVLVLHFAGAYFGPTPKARRAIGTLLIFEAAMLGLILSDDLFLLFTFWELTGLCSFFLIATDADKRDDTFAAAQQALIVTVGGALPMLIGFLYIVLCTGTSSLSDLVTSPPPVTVQTIALALILPGILSKSAQVPLHFWLPGAMAAPTPISAYLHSATMVKAGIILLLFLFPICGETELWRATLVPLGTLTCLWGAYRALGEDDIKLLMAWSTVSQLGLMVITAGLGTDLAIRAATLYLFAHAIFKAGLFLGIGGIDHAAHTRNLSALGGLGRRAPALAFVVALLAGSMAGLPPFVGFLSKELVLKKLLLADPFLHDLAVIGIVLGSVGTVAYTCRFYFGTFAGQARSSSAAEASPIGWNFLFAPAVLGVVSLAGGLGAIFVDRYMLEPVTAALLGYPLGVPELRIWHGINVPLILSTGIVLFGYSIHRLLGHRALPKGPLPSGPRFFEAFLSGAQRFGATMNQALAGAPPAVYLALALILGFYPALGLSEAIFSMGTLSWNGAGLLILILLAVGLFLLVSLRSKVGRILALTSVGFAVALLYGQLSAPDLVLTQLLVEVLTTIFFLLAVRFMVGREPSERKSAPMSLLRWTMAGGVGLASMALVLNVHRLPSSGRLPDYYFRAAPEIAHGMNLVNVTLVDFRALDTLVESLVVVLACIGVVGLLMGREWLSPVRSERKEKM